MKIFKSEQDYENYVQNPFIRDRKIGFVPTMGALHDGHLRLIEECKRQTELTVCSIFVNPTQFNQAEDLKKYPKTLEADILKLEAAGCDVLFLPSEQAIYPTEASRHQHYELGFLETILEGTFRPGHYQGVSMVVDRLLNIIHPHFLFLGEKDFQQCKVIELLIQLSRHHVEIKTVATVRQPNGLAMSSRNARLTMEEQSQAAAIYQALMHLKTELNSGKDFIRSRDWEVAQLTKKDFEVEYLELASRKGLTIQNHFLNDDSQILLIAASFKGVRLIDNIFL